MTVGLVSDVFKILFSPAVAISAQSTVIANGSDECYLGIGDYIYSGLQKVCLPQTYKHINISAALWDPFCEEFYGSTPLQDKNVL